MLVLTPLGGVARYYLSYATSQALSLPTSIATDAPSDLF
jgi:hypothetical protein